MSLYHKTQVQMVLFNKLRHSMWFYRVQSAQPCQPLGSNGPKRAHGSVMERKIECILRNNVKTGKLPSEISNI